MSEERIDKVTGCIIGIWSDANKQKGSPPQSPIGTVLTTSTNTIILGQNGVDAQEACLGFLITKQIEKNWSRSFIEGLLSESLVKLMDSSSNEIELNSRNAAEELIAKLETSVQSWKIITPLDNLLIGEEKFSIGQVEFGKFGEVRFQAELDSLFPKMREAVLTPLRDRFLNRVYAEITVYA